MYLLLPLRRLPLRLLRVLLPLLLRAPRQKEERLESCVVEKDTHPDPPSLSPCHRRHHRRGE
jgi:hypothetical protein